METIVKREFTIYIDGFVFTTEIVGVTHADGRKLFCIGDYDQEASILDGKSVSYDKDSNTMYFYNDNLHVINWLLTNRKDTVKVFISEESIQDSMNNAHREYLRTKHHYNNDKCDENDWKCREAYDYYMNLSDTIQRYQSQRVAFLPVPSEAIQA